MSTASQQWSQGTFGCFGNFGLLVKYCLCGSCVYGSAMATAKVGSCLICCLFGRCWVCCNRTKLREAYNIEGSCASDWLCHMFCGCCSALQELNEIEKKSNADLGCFGVNAASSHP
eukprot:CAMPEP_0116937578 /NCGR_PEP_ID=MMETSP0467-20121206/31587_1 /TAXON_ID=283647 /ORGANISM="Mesodinium pulex, Strain SPMC105" /LENGTH=115 /DNA_ID=CAMNT_0004619419 /DNA_START=39 /DNA_END=386 /DNA_ORIENTATION=+